MSIKFTNFCRDVVKSEAPARNIDHEYLSFENQNRKVKAQIINSEIMNKINKAWC